MRLRIVPHRCLPGVLPLPSTSNLLLPPAAIVVAVLDVAHQRSRPHLRSVQLRVCLGLSQNLLPPLPGGTPLELARPSQSQ